MLVVANDGNQELQWFFPYPSSYYTELHYPSDYMNRFRSTAILPLQKFFIILDHISRGRQGQGSVDNKAGTSVKDDPLLQVFCGGFCRPRDTKWAAERGPVKEVSHWGRSTCQEQRPQVRQVCSCLHTVSRRTWNIQPECPDQ